MPPCGESTMHVINHTETYDETDGRYEYSGSRVIFELDGSLYLARSNVRLVDKDKVEEVDLIDRTLIPIDAYAPLFTPALTAFNGASRDCFIKRPSLSSYDKVHPYKIINHVLAESKTCEFLKQHPHPNVARYLGCMVQNGRIMGLCFTRYGQTLLDRVNPGYHNKRAFVISGWSMDVRDRWLNGIEKALEHLHSFGLVHNDVTPANIMFDEDDNPILIDFGSCMPTGHSLKEVGGTYEWHDEDVEISEPKNDMDALDEIREWLSDKPDKKFKFKE